ncbi:unnamed protein product [Haemonchus placei]|uniref:Uncharacterized protein n=1 Tax=Haemonchus placei TaxID=6290 RepID=A0A0N4VSC4_HAEPC|nr:unnamed protein product [Haemonchus placei]
MDVAYHVKICNDTNFCNNYCNPPVTIEPQRRKCSAFSFRTFISKKFLFASSSFSEPITRRQMIWTCLFRGSSLCNADTLPQQCRYSRTINRRASSEQISSQRKRASHLF